MTTTRKLSRTQHEALDRLLSHDGEKMYTDTLSHYRRTTVDRLRNEGLVQRTTNAEYLLAEYYNLRVRYYDLTEAGRQVVLANRAAKQTAHDTLMGR